MYQKNLLLALSVFVMTGCGGNTSTSVEQEPNVYVGSWLSPCFSSLGDTKIEYKFDDNFFSVNLIHFAPDSNCDGAIEIYDEIQSLEYDLGEFVTTQSGISAQVLTIYGESSSVSNLVFRDGDALYLGWHEDEELPSDVNLLDPFYLQ